jgi:vacuolar-type H+-ATPase subunit E/Vma4
MKMETVEERMQALARAVLGEAHAEAQKIQADAKAVADATLHHAQEQAASERGDILGHARQEAEHIRSQAIAAAQLRAQTLRLGRREKLLESVFDAARQRLATVQQSSDYGQIVRQLIREATAHLGTDSVHIRADEKTRSLLTDEMLAELAEKLGVQLLLGPPLERGTGVMAETADGRRQYDNTLEARLKRWQDMLRSPVYRLLMGDYHEPAGRHGDQS